MQVEGAIHINEDSEAVDSLSDMRADDRKPASLITSDVLNNSNNTNVLNSGSEKPVKLHEKTAYPTDNLSSVDMSITEIEENPAVSTVHSQKVKPDVKHPETGNSIQFGDTSQEINSKQDLCNGVNTFVTGSSVSGSKSTKFLSEDIDMEPVVDNVKTECSTDETFEELPWRDVKPVITVKHENDLSCGTLVNDELANTCTDNSNKADLSVNDCRPDVENSTSAQSGEALDVNCVEQSSECESNHLGEKNGNSDATKNVDNHNHLNKSNSVSSQGMNTHFSKDIPVDSENDELDKTQDPEDIIAKDQAKVGGKTRLSIGDTEKISDAASTDDDDDDIIIVSDIVKSEPVSKYSFKNILQMPNSYARNEGISNSKRNDTFVDKAESQPVKDTVQQKSAGVSKAESQPVKDTVQQKSAGVSKEERQPVKDTVQQKPTIESKAERQPVKDTVQQKPAGVSKVKSEKLDVDDSLDMADSATGSLDNESGSNRKRIQNERSMRSAAKRVKLEPENEEYLDDAMSDTDWTPPEKKTVKRTRNGHSSNQKDETSVVISSEVLQSIIALRVNTAIKKQKQANLERLSLRTRGMLTASGLWKETVKHLERSVQELSTLSQKLEKQKTQLETSSPVKAQDPAATKFPLLQPQTAVGQSQVQPSSSNPAQQSSALSTQTHIRRRPGRPIKTYPTQPAPPSIPPAAAAAAPSLQPVSTPPARPAQPTTIKTSESPPQSGPFINLIDLTDEEDSARKRNTHVQISNPVLSQQLIHSTNKILSPGQTAVSPLGNGYIQQGPVRQGSSSNLVNSNKSPVVSSQILSPVNSMVDISGSQYQLVTISGSSIPQNGTILALLPGSAANASVIPKQPEITASSRSVPVHSVADTALASTAKTSAISLQPSYIINKQHPAPLPPIVDVGTAPPNAKSRPPKPTLRISKVAQGIVLSWNMVSLVDVEKIATYQLFAYQESEVATSRSNLWKKVGEVNALPLPMACTLTQFQAGNKYHFSVRAVDQYGRCGSYSDPSSIYLGTDP